MRRTKTSIPGLDEILQGGFPSPSTILVYGPPGSYKTIFGLQYVYYGAKDLGEPGIYIQIEGYKETLVWYAELFGWDFAKEQKSNRLVIYSFLPIDYSKFELENLSSEIITKLSGVIDDLKVKRIVIDSVTPLALWFNSDSEFRAVLYYLSRTFKDKGCTTIYISEKREHMPEKYVVDGVIHMDITEHGDTIFHTLSIEKMIATGVDYSKYYIDLTQDGLQLSFSRL